MLSQKFYNYLLNANYSFDESMSAYNNSLGIERGHIRSKTLNRREPALSYNVTLLIEIGMVVVVSIIIGLVIYFSQRNFKKRSNVHRRRWLESDIDIDNYNDGQIYDTNTTLNECQSQPIDLDQDDCPPPYESVVQQSTLKKKGRHYAKPSRKYKNNFNGSNENLPKYQSNGHDEFQHNTSSREHSEPLISSQTLKCISIISNENSSLMENRHSASTSSPDEDSCVNGDGECRRSLKVIEVHIHRLQNPKLVGANGEKETNEKVKIDPMKTVGCENEIALLDASGLPSYDTALKIQECGNM